MGVLWCAAGARGTGVLVFAFFLTLFSSQHPFSPHAVVVAVVDAIRSLVSVINVYWLELVYWTHRV